LKVEKLQVESNLGIDMPLINLCQLKRIFQKRREQIAITKEGRLDSKKNKPLGVAARHVETGLAAARGIFKIGRIRD